MNKYLALTFLLFSSTAFASPPDGGVRTPGNPPVVLKSSIERLSRDAVDGDVDAAAQLKNYYRYEKNYDKRWEYWALIAAENGDSTSQFDEYQILRSNEDVLTQRRSLFWLKKSANKGNKDAILELKSCFSSGNFDPHSSHCVGKNSD